MFEISYRILILIIKNQHANNIYRNVFLYFLLVAPEKKEAKADEKTETAQKTETEAPAKPKPAAAKAKAPVKALPQLMEEEVIPSLKATLEAEEDISELELGFQDNKVIYEFISIEILSQISPIS